MARIPKSILSPIGLLVLFTLSQNTLGSQTITADAEHCMAQESKSGLTLIEGTTENTSELCFTRFNELSAGLAQIIPVHISAVPLRNGREQRILNIPRQQLKTKQFLKQRPLLIFSAPHERYALAQLCHELIRAGFELPKILIGERPNRFAQVDHAPVKAEDFLVELSHFGAITIASNEEIAQALAELGIPAIQGEINSTEAMMARSAHTNYSLNGYLPVFLVTESAREQGVQSQLRQSLPDEAFVVAGGVSAIRGALKNSAAGAVKRMSPEEMPGCAG
ncbi:hypothetical protein [Microbulbifer discodermiae]|uniref:hypothetical protein n=1 Tax=Microbulbifer sp. 2201CG32-9 TaxID=3232309 RepID=UPI00345BB99C